MDIKELNEFMREHGFCNTDNEDDLPKKYVCDLVESAMKDGYAKAITEFAERLRLNTSEFEIMNGFGEIEDRVDAITISKIDEIAEEMRGVK